MITLVNNIKYLFDLLFLYFIFYISWKKIHDAAVHVARVYIVEIKNCNAFVDLSDGFKSIACNNVSYEPLI